jgi:hypothetical protein
MISFQALRLQTYGGRREQPVLETLLVPHGSRGMPGLSDSGGSPLKSSVRTWSCPELHEFCRKAGADQATRAFRLTATEKPAA